MERDESAQKTKKKMVIKYARGCCTTIAFSYDFCMVNSGMVGNRKEFNKNCLSVAVEDYIPKDNIYRRLKKR